MSISDKVDSDKHVGTNLRRHGDALIILSYVIAAITMLLLIYSASQPSGPPSSDFSTTSALP